MLPDQPLAFRRTAAMRDLSPRPRGRVLCDKSDRSWSVWTLQLPAYEVLQRKYQLPLQNIVEARQQMRNSLLCLIPHVRQAKSLAADLAVTGINHQMMFFPQLFHDLQHVDAFIVFHAGQRLRAEPFLGKKIESRTAHPIVHERIGACVTSVTRFETFLENFIELELERVNVPDARRTRRHPLRLLAPELQKIEIKSAIRNFPGACKRLFRN